MPTAAATDAIDAPSDVPIPQIRLYQNWLTEHRGLTFARYEDLWRWSSTDLNGFWQSIWDYFELQSPTPHTAVLADNVMPGAKWFTGAQFNYAHQVFRHVQAADAAGCPALVAGNERGQYRELSWPELRRQVAALALHLQAQGVRPGDRVAAYLPNVPETMVAFLATVSIGAIWSVCAPDMGTPAVLDRFSQITPKVLIACDGVVYGGRELDRRATVRALCAALPTVQHLIVLPILSETPQIIATEDAKSDDFKLIAGYASFTSVTSENNNEIMAFEPLWLPFDHPLWIVYSSGTTGLPKPIVHGHGGTVIVALALKCLHNDVGCSYHPNTWGERFFWYSSTGWVMWNAQLSGLLSGTTCCIYDGSPGGSKEAPDWGTLWRFASAVGVSFFGAGAAFYAQCLKAGVDVRTCGDLSRIRALGSTGSPLSAEAQSWGSAQFAALGQPDIWWCNISGGTDFAGAFIGGHRELPMKVGEMQCRLLGCAVEAWDEQGRPVMGEVGELVCTQPIPSMPLKFWGDEDGKRLLGSYFDTYPAGLGRRPGGGDGDARMGAVWRHGDWLRIDPDTGGCVIAGRSDATINRHGLRMGTSDIYAAVEALPEILDSLVVDVEVPDRPSHMPLFVVLREGTPLDAALRQRIHTAIRQRLSPRFIPDDILAVTDIPRTLSGKKQELPIKKLLLGRPLTQVLNPDAMANPQCLAWYAAYAQSWLAHGHVV